MIAQFCSHSLVTSRYNNETIPYRVDDPHIQFICMYVCSMLEMRGTFLSLVAVKLMSRLSQTLFNIEFAA